MAATAYAAALAVLHHVVMVKPAGEAVELAAFELLNVAAQTPEEKEQARLLRRCYDECWWDVMGNELRARRYLSAEVA